MKQSKLKLLFTAIFMATVMPLFAQDTLPEVIISAVRYKYLSAVDQKDVAMPVRQLERQAATYDVKKTELYEDDYGTYYVSFYIPEGNILAAYDRDGKLLRTVEKFKNVALPNVVASAIVSKHPGWKIAKDVYLVNYNEGSGATKTYKVTLEKGDKRMKVKTNEKGEFL